MRGEHDRASEFGPDWRYRQPRRSHAYAAPRHPATQGTTLVWLMMFLFMAGVVGASGQAALKSLDRANQSLAQVFNGR